MTRDELLKLIEENGGPEGIDLTGEDLSGLDLGTDAMQNELEQRGLSTTPSFPSWVYVVDGVVGGINLRKAILQKANLKHAILKGARLWDAELHEANLWWADLRGAKMLNAQLQGARVMHARLTDAVLSGADLEGAIIAEADLEAVNLSNANLQGAVVRGCNLGGANLQGALLRELDFLRSNHLDGIWLFGAKLARTNLARKQLGNGVAEEIGKDGKIDYYRAKETYLALKTNFEGIGRYGDASWAYGKERQMEKMMNHPRLAREYYASEDGLPPSANWRSPRWWSFYFQHTGQYLIDSAVELSCGYGESINRVITSLVWLWFLSAVYYRLCWGVLGPNGGSVTSFRDYLVYSLGALTIASFDHLRPRLDLGWVPAVTALEGLLGIFLTGLLGFVVANRIRRS